MSRHWLLTSVALLTMSGASARLLSAQIPQTPQTPYRTAQPGTVNYVEGQTSIDGRPLNTRQDGNTQLQPNQSLMTANGKAEMLLSPGVFVRIGNNSEVRMVSNQIVNPTIDIVRGEALVEVDTKPHEGQLTVLEHGAKASILKPGLYRFNMDQNQIAVLDGKLSVTENERTKEFGKGHELLLNNPKLKTVGFDPKAPDDLYTWSSVRSSELAQANQMTAQSAYMGYGPWWGPGWYWSPYYAMWSWLPGDGWFYSPFGYPFFSPGFAVYGRAGYGFRGGFAGRAGARAFAGGSFRGGGFHGAAVGSGGFHGGGGGGRR